MQDKTFTTKIVNVDVGNLDFTNGVFRFFETVARKMGYDIVPKLTQFNPFKICVSPAIANRWYKDFLNAGLIDDDDTYENFISTAKVFGPTVSDDLTDGQVVVEYGFCYEAFDLDAAIDEILNENDEETLESIVETYNEEVASDEETYRRKARAMLDAYKSGDVNAFCMATTGWSIESILKKAKAIPDYDHTFYDEADDEEA